MDVKNLELKLLLKKRVQTSRV